MSDFVFKFHFKFYCRWASQSSFGQQFLRIYNNYIMRLPRRINQRKLYLAIIFLSKHNIYPLREYLPQIAKFMGPTWGPLGSCRPQMGPMLAPWTLLSGTFCTILFALAYRRLFSYPTSAPAWLDQQFNSKPTASHSWWHNPVISNEITKWHAVHYLCTLCYWTVRLTFINSLCQIQKYFIASHFTRQFLVYTHKV